MSPFGTVQAPATYEPFLPRHDEHPAGLSPASVFSAAYFLALLPILSKQSLWLDEIIDLRGVRDHTISQLPAFAANNAGGVPLGYLVQGLFAKLIGVSAFAGRLSSALFSAAACFAIGFLCRRSGRKVQLLAMIFFVLCPLQLRYATEARPYAQALFFSVAATAVFVELVRRPTILKCLLYAAALTAGLYSQPFTIFVPVAHWVWLVLPISSEHRKRALLAVSFTGAMSLLAFVPWYAYARSFWRASVIAGQFQFAFGWKEVSLLLREITGAGYIGSALLLLSCAWGLTDQRLSKSGRWFWLLLCAFPFAALAADAYFGYFIAIRQFLSVLTPLVLLAAIGIDRLRVTCRPAAATAFQFLLLFTFVVGDFRWFTKPREDWKETAATLRRVRQPGSCAIFVPETSRTYYEFFDATIGELSCSQEPLAQTVWVVVSPYDAAAEYQSAVERLRQSGFTRRGSVTKSAPIIEEFRR